MEYIPYERITIRGILMVWTTAFQAEGTWIRPRTRTSELFSEFMCEGYHELFSEGNHRGRTYTRLQSHLMMAAISTELAW